MRPWTAEREPSLQLKKAVEDVSHHLLAIWVSNGIIALGTVAFSYWGLIAANWSWPSVSLAVIVLVTCGLALRDRVMAWRRKTVLPLDSNAPPSQVNLKWLHDIADKDDKEIQQRLFFLNRDTSGHSELGANDPYVDIKLWFVNSSVYTLTLERLDEGDSRVKYLGHDLQHAPEIWSPIPQRTMAHGETKQFIVRQWLTADTARKMIAGEGGANPQEAKYGLDIGRVGLHFGYTNHQGERKTIRKGLVSGV